MPTRPSFDDLRSSYKPTGICVGCGKASALLCDGRIYRLPSGEELRVPASFFNGKTRSCDAMICRACAKKVSDVHMRLAKGCRWDSIDLCPACTAVEGLPVDDPKRKVVKIDVQ